MASKKNSPKEEAMKAEVKELTIISLDDPEEEIVEKKKKTTKTTKKKTTEDKPAEKIVSEATVEKKVKKTSKKKEVEVAKEEAVEEKVAETVTEVNATEKVVEETPKPKRTYKKKVKEETKEKTKEEPIEEKSVETLAEVVATETVVEVAPKPKRTYKKKVKEEIKEEIKEAAAEKATAETATEVVVEATVVEENKETAAQETTAEKKAKKTSKKKGKEEKVDLSHAEEIVVTLEASHHEELADELPDSIEVHEVVEAKRVKKEAKKSKFNTVLSMLKDAVVLTVITLVAGFMLGFVYEVTKTAIAEQEAKAVQKACAKVFESADSFELLEYTPNENLAMRLNENGVIIGRVYKALDAEGTSLGYVIETTSKKAYAGKITLFMGVTMQNRLNGISILTISETPGLGMRAGEVLVPQFKDKMLATFVYTKSGSVLANEIDAISGATITTKAVVNAVNGGVEVMLEELMKGGK